MSNIESRSLGKYFTKSKLSLYVYKLLKEKIKRCDVLIEPFAGDGSLIEPFLKENIRLIVNDLVLSEDLKNLSPDTIEIHNEDFISLNKRELIHNWINQCNSSQKNILVYSNPPFGTKSTNQLASKRDELSKTKSRAISIRYGGLENRYGRGDIILPALGSMIDLVIENENGHLAFFSPLGIFCGRKRYNKLLRVILKDFEFIYGEIFSGDFFENVSKRKPISFTLWEYKKEVHTKLTSLSFVYGQKIIPLKPAPLLKDHWSYDNRKYVKGEIMVQGNDRFNVPAPKMLHSNPTKGGSELISENVKKSLSINGLPDELIYGLWSLTIGHRSLTTYPIYMDNAYVHLPDFSEPRVQKILSLIALYEIIYELEHDYCNGKVFLDLDKRKIHFGGSQLTMGIKTLFSKYGYVKTASLSIQSIIAELFSFKFENIPISRYKSELKQAIQEHLQKLNYFEYIPIPEKWL